MPVPSRHRIRGVLTGAVASLGLVAAALVLPTASQTVLASADTAADTAADTGTRTGAVEDPQVLAISLDGFNPNALRKLGRKRAPHLWRLFDEGAGTLNARTQLELTVTLPNHTSMVTGRRIDRAKGGHGVTWNDDRLTPSTVQAAAHHAVSSVFSQVDARGGSTALYAAKTKFSLWERSWTSSIDQVGIFEEDDDAVVEAARIDLRDEDRDFTFVHLGAADKTGHAYGWMSPRYLQAVRSLDRLVGLVLDDADSEPALDDLTIILTADHGGVPGAKDHSATRKPANYTIPFVVWGPGVGHRDLYEINPGYRNPGTRQPALSVRRQPVRNGDVANLALSLLGMGKVPGSLFGRARPLKVH